MESSPRTPGLPDTGEARPRILILAYQIVPNDARFLKLRASLTAAGFEVAALAPALRGRKIHPDVMAAPAGERPGHAPGAWLWARRIADKLVASGAAFAPNVIYAFDPEALPAALRLKQRTGAALIYDAHEFHEDEDPSKPARGAWVRRTELKAAPQLDAFVTVNRSIADLYYKERPGLPDPLVVHNAVDPDGAVVGDDRLRKAAGFSDEVNILLYQGGLAPMRGLDRLVAAAPLLSAKWRLAIMGDGPLLGSLKSAADPDRVRFLPPAPHADLQAWTSGAQLGALLYDDTGRNQHYCSPNKVWEYAAAGVPALASDLPEIARVVRGEQTGFLIAPDASPKQIANAVNALSPQDLGAAASHARSFSMRETWSSEVAPLIATVRRLCAGFRRSQ